MEYITHLVSCILTSFLLATRPFLLLCMLPSNKTINLSSEPTFYKHQLGTWESYCSSVPPYVPIIEMLYNPNKSNGVKSLRTLWFNIGTWKDYYSCFNFLTYSCLLYEFNLPVILPYYMLKGYTVIDTS